jgi:hypothetical protein
MLVFLSKLLGILSVIPFHELSLLPSLGRTLVLFLRHAQEGAFVGCDFRSGETLVLMSCGRTPKEVYVG